jgi:glycine/D-amino acid oxidase-like deaminating enzyme/nitrite reductase/ring-hydroxylating ferredoxin subunit
MTLASLWQDRHPRPRRLSAASAIDGTTEVAVVGGGITGLTAAVLLSRAGKAVTLLEARRIGDGTTGRSTAKVSLLQGTQLSRIAGRHPAETVRKYVEANAEGLAWLARFCDDHGVATQRRPAYTYATTASGERAARREVDVARAAGLAVEWRHQLALPFETRGGARLADQLQVDPFELLEALEGEARAHGVHVIEGARVTRIRDRGPVRVITEHGSLGADIAVLATNMPILDRGGFFARMTPARTYGLAFVTGSAAVDGMYLSADSPTRSLRDAPALEGGSMLLVGGQGHTTGRGGATSARLDTLRKWTLDHFPGAVETHAWSAQDYVPAHALPFAGPVLPGVNEILMAGGYSKWGLTNGVAAALAITERVLGGHLEWAEVFHPWRGGELRGLPNGVLYNAEVGVEMARGWLLPLLRPGTGPSPAEGAGVVRYDRLGTPTAEATADGVDHRVSAVCTHLGGVVSWNDAERSWDCPLHGSRFGPDGQVLEGPATCGLRAR